VDGAVHAAAPKQGRIRCIDDRIHALAGDVALQYLYAMAHGARITCSRRYHGRGELIHNLRVCWIRLDQT
jgi:hypothetical protein